MAFSIPFLKRNKKKDKKDPQEKNVIPETAINAGHPVDVFSKGIMSVRDIIAPSAIEVDFNYLKIGNTFFRSLFVNGYPRFVAANWLSPLINFDHSLTVSMFIYPVEGKEILDQLHRKIAEMEAELQSDIQRGRIVNPDTQAKLEDSRALQEVLVKGIERFFQFGLYITIPSHSLEELNQVSSQVISTLGSLLIVAKPTSLEMEKGFKSTLPYANDAFMITRNMDTTSLATTFPFVSSELTSNEGIMYGINEHNGSLIVFDRFSMENANSVVFAKSGAGKSFTIKLEALRSLMFGTEIIIIDPENEYEAVCNVVGGEYISFGMSSVARINPFDLSAVTEPGENALSMKILSLHSLFKIIMGDMSPSEEATLDRAFVMTYKMKGITPDPETQIKQPPLLEDLYKALLGMEEVESKSLADRIEKFVKGSFRGIFDQPSNVDLRNPFTVFSIRDLEDSLRPIAMFIILDYIWSLVRREMKRRILIVDEAWYMMRYGDSAQFMYSIAKRARKYYLGMTTITQDVEDFLTTDYGRAIVTNSSIQILLKQSTAAIRRLTEVFYLSEGEQHLLLSADVGQGLFFAGPSHVAVRVIASPEEYALVTTKPQDSVVNPILGSNSEKVKTIQKTIEKEKEETQKQKGEIVTDEDTKKETQPAQKVNKTDIVGTVENKEPSQTPPQQIIKKTDDQQQDQTNDTHKLTPQQAMAQANQHDLSSKNQQQSSSPQSTGGMIGGGRVSISGGQSSSDDNKNVKDTEKQLHKLSNLELAKINEKIKNPIAARDPQFKSILKKITDDVSPMGNVPNKTIKKIEKFAQNEITKRYHQGAWTEDTLPSHILPTKDVISTWSDKELQNALNTAENLRFSATGRDASKAGQKMALLQYYKNKRQSKGKWELKE